MFKKVFLFIMIFIFYISIGVVISKSKTINDNILRFHIIANSNSTYDQSVKMLLKDNLYDKYNKDFSSFKSKKEAIGFFERNSSEIEKNANDFLNSIGYDKSVSLIITNDFFSNKKYNDITIPSGNYDAIKLKIGSAKGRNFFGVIFPQFSVSNNVTVSVDKNNKGNITYKSKIAEMIVKIFK